MLLTPQWPPAYDRIELSIDIRRENADFEVTECLGFELQGDGDHEYLWLQKSGINTDWLAKQLARYCGVKPVNVGYAGMKDRHAVTRQWFSVRTSTQIDWQAFDLPGVTLLQHQRHRRKLRRGAHAGNEFRIALRAPEIAAHRTQLEQRLAVIQRDGVPNYFGEQRFGRGGNNLQLARRLFAGHRLSRSQRGIALSAARAFLFNEILAQRVSQGTWNRILPGELASLDGSNSIFAVDAVNSEIAARCARHDIHPSGSLWGQGAPRASADVAALEVAVADKHSEFVAGLVAARVQAASRALWLRVSDLRWSFEAGALWLEFRLVRGAFASAVLREIAQCNSPSR